MFQQPFKYFYTIYNQNDNILIKIDENWYFYAVNLNIKIGIKQNLLCLEGGHGPAGPPGYPTGSN